MEQGWVYVLVNPSTPGLVKVGRTTRLPSTRVAELSQATGVATPFILVFEQAFADCVSAERDIHKALDRCGIRVAANREFFRGPTTEVVRLIVQYAFHTGDDSIAASQHSGPELLTRGDRCLLGQGNTLQDLSGAIRYYQMAAARGSLLAFERLGIVIAQTKGAARGGRARAVAYLNEGARRGNYYCYCDLAADAAEEGRVANFTRAWDLFFSQRQSVQIEEVEAGQDRYPNALRRYVVACFALGLRPGHLAALTADADALVRCLTATLSGPDRPAELQRVLRASLKWARQTLVTAPDGKPGLLPGWNWLTVCAERCRGTAAWLSARGAPAEREWLGAGATRPI